MTKHEQAKITRAQTRLRRSTMDVAVYRLKISKNHLSGQQRHHLNMLFVEAKWLRNHYVADIENHLSDRKPGTVTGLNKDGLPVVRKLKHLSSQMKQSINQKVKDDLKGLSASKNRGRKVGRLAFKSEVTMIELVQPGITYRLDGNRLSIQKLPGTLRLRGLKQLPCDYEEAKAELVSKPSGYYLHLTVFTPQQEQEKAGAIGIDFGIKDQLTFSNGLQLAFDLPETPRLKYLQRQLAKKQRGSNNRRKLKLKLQKEYERLTNRRQDIQNKIVGYLKTFESVSIQNDSIKSWHQGWFGKQVQGSALGAIKSRIQQLESVTVIDRYQKTSGVCPHCFTINLVKLSDREFTCSNCSAVWHRDLASALVILNPAEHRGKRAEMIAPAWSWPSHVRVSYVDETRCSLFQ